MTPIPDPINQSVPSKTLNCFHRGFSHPMSLCKLRRNGTSSASKSDEGGVVLPEIDLATYVPAWQLEESARLAADARQGLGLGDISSEEELPL